MEMKKLLLILALLAAPSATAGVTEEEQFMLNNQFGGVPFRVQLGNKLKQETEQVAYAVYDYDIHGGGYSKDIDLGVKIPKNSILKGVVYKVLSKVDAVTPSSARIQLGASTAANLLNSTLLTNLAPVGGVSQGALPGEAEGASTFLWSGASTTSIKMRVTGSKLTSGKILFIVEYLGGQ